MITAVTGGTGHVGSALVRVLLSQGRKVRVLVRDDATPLQGLDVEQVRGDVRDLDSLLSFLEGADVLYHCAALISIGGVSRETLEAVNVGGVANIIDACLAKGVRRLIHVSSVHAVSEIPMEHPVVETNGLLKPHEGGLPYSHTKAKAQGLVLDAVATRGLNAVIVNPTSVIGPYDFRGSHVGEVISDIAAGRLLAVVPGGYDFVDNRDLADSIVAAETLGTTGENYLLGGHHIRISELAAEVSQQAGRRPPRWTCPLWLAHVAAPFNTIPARLLGRRPKFTNASIRVLQGNTQVNSSKAKAQLKHNPRPFPDTIRDILSWQREAGWK